MKKDLTKTPAPAIIKSSKGKQKERRNTMYGYYIDSEETADIIMDLTEEELEKLAKDWD